jgi:hypothetical protein
MADEELKILEKFILSENKEEVLKEFLSTSDIKFYLEGNDLISKNPSDPRVEQILKLIQGNSDLYAKLNLRRLIKLYESTSDPETATLINNTYFGNTFNYPAPRAVQSEEIEQVPNVLKFNIPDIASAAETEKSFNTLTPEGKYQLNISSTSNPIFKKLLSGNDLYTYSNLPERFIKYYQEKLFLETESFKSMSLTQLKTISELDPSVWSFDTFAKAWVKKEYFLRTQSMNDDQKYEFMKTIAIEVQNNPRYNSSLRTVVLLNVLILEIKLGKCGENWLLSYLNYHRPSHLYVDSSSYNPASISVFSELLIDKTLTEESILEYYINTLLFSNPNIEAFKPYIKLDYLKSIKSKVLILKGEPIETIEDYKNYTDLLTSVELEPSHDNPKEFNRNELVKFAMNIKNISRLLIKVLELNPKNYYLTNKQQIKTNIELDGLIAKTEYSYEYTEPSQIRSRKVFEFPELNGKVGIFVIEFFGNGRHSRALIKKGSLRYISNVTINGHIVYIMNEDNEICKKGAGLYLDSRFFEADSDGKIELPFARDTSQKNLILVYGDLSELITDFIHQSESYELKTAFVVHKEQLITGAHTSVFIKPRVFINKITAPNSLLKDSKVTVSTKDSAGPSSIKEYSNIAVPELGQAIEIEIEVPPRITELSIKFESVIENTEDIKIPLTSEYFIRLNELLSTTATCGVFLRLTSDEYLLEVRGRNGEPVSRQRVEVTLNHLYWKEPVNQTLSTDSNGEIHLGKLEDISVLSARVTLENSRPQSHSWELKSFKGKIEYPELIQLCEGDEFGIPVELNSSDLSNEILFFSESSGYIIDDVIHYLSYDAESSMLLLTKLDPGSYNLIFKKTLTTIKINVVEGVHFNNEFILQENAVVVGNNQYNVIGIKDIIVENENVNVKVSGYTDENTVVYALFFNYLTSDLLKTVSELQKIKEDQISQKFEFDRPNNYYLASNKLDEEYQYVLNRSSFPRFVGNILQKPQILLKRVLVGDTSTEIQTAQKGEPMMESLRMSRCAMNDMARNYPLSAALSIQLGLNIPLEFLKYNAKILVAPISNKEAVFKIPGEYSVTLIIASNSSNVAYKLVPLPSQVPIKDIRLKSSAVDCTEVCKSKSIFTGETFELEDFPSTTLKIIDSFDRLYDTLKAFRTDTQTDTVWDWSFLLTWPRLPLDKKIEIYDKYASHELNLFLYNRDKSFFEAVVKPFVQSKMKKDLIDSYICGESLDHWTSLDSISKLNYLEIALLVDRIKHTNIEIATSLVKMLKDIADSNELSIQDRTNKIELVLKFNEVSPSLNNFAIGKDSDEYNQNFFADEDINEYEMCESISERGGGGGMERSLPRVAKKKMLGAFYKKSESAKEYTETYYYKPAAGLDQQKSARFYYELAESFIKNSSWLSESLLESITYSSNLIPILSYAAVPFTPERHTYKSDGNSWSITASSPLLIFYKEVTKADLELSSQVFTAVKYFESSSATEVKQFIKEKPYSCKLVITNISGGALDFSILTQIPEGSIPLSPPYYSKAYFMHIENYTTSSLDFEFYFPQSGTFNHNPASQAVNGKIISKADIKKIDVLDTYDVSILETFKDLVVSGRKDLIIQFLNTENIKSSNKNFSLNEIYWMLRQKDFWNSVIEVYRKRLVFDRILWSFGFYHNDKQAISEYIKADPVFKKKIGYFFDSEIVKTDSEDFQHLEFDPLVNARAYKLGNQERITNTRFKEVYKNYLYYLSEKKVINNEDLLCLSQYFILQERYSEAKSLHQKISISPSSEKIIPGPLQLQYDYISCYLDLEKAKTIAPLYSDYPVSTWNKKFKEVANLVQELESEDVPQATHIEKEPTLDFKIENNNIVLNYENIQSCTVRIYKIDLEILFSKNPFLIQNSQSFSYVRANHELSIDLSGNTHTVSIDEYKGKNIFIEVDYKTYSISKSYFSNNLVINCIQRFGQIKVMDNSRKPRPAAYVKVFARKFGGEVEFYKDGYTDIRGKFDYVSLNTDILATIQKFSLLVVDDELGSVVQEADPPPQ